MIIRIVLFLFFVLSIFSCGKKQKDTAADKKTTFRYNELSGITSLDPAASGRFENIWAVNQLFNGLVKMDDSLRIVGDIAKRWTISNDGKEYTFTLRSDVYFHDDTLFEDGKGRRVTAHDFVHSFFRLYDASVSSATTFLNVIDRSEKSNNKGFLALNDTTFKIFLKNSFPPFLGVLTMKFFSVVPHEIIEHYGHDFRSHPIGTGPFKFKIWEEGVKLVLVKNENYFEKENDVRLPYVDAVSISFIKDKETAFMEFMKGNIDMISGIDAINKDEVFTRNGELNELYKQKFYVQSQPYLKTDYLGFLIDPKNKLVEYSPIKIKAVRQAINYGIDRKKMVKYLHAGFGTPATKGFIPPGLSAFDKNSSMGYDYDPEKARQLLASAGFPNGYGLPEITLYSTEQYTDVCEFIQSQLKDIGVRVNINIEKAAILYEAVASSEVLFFRKSWLADYPDAESFLSVFYSKNFSPHGYNYTHYKNAKFDALYEQAQSEQDEQKRMDLYKQMDKLIIEEAPIVPLYYDHVVRLVNKNVSGLTFNAMNILDLKKVKKASN